VATDVAARGLDLPDLGIVIHADLPGTKADLLHRSGRTGRAGRKGVSVLLVTHTKRRKMEQILNAANINALWSGPPTADEINALDRTRLLDDPIFAEQPSEEDLALAKLVMDKLSPEQIAATLMRLRRAEHPEPEDVRDDVRMRDRENRERPARERTERPERAERPEHGERPPRETPNDNAWFRINVGRRKNAEPRWLVPYICRFGNVTKKDIGPIRIFEDETKFAILGGILADFTAAVAAATDSEMSITPSAPPGERPPPYERKRPQAHEERKSRDGSEPMAREPRTERLVEQRPPRREDRPAKPAYTRPTWQDVARDVQQAEAPPRDKGMRQRKRKQLEKLAQQDGNEKPAEFVKPPRHAERPHGKPAKFAGKHPGAKRVEGAAHRGKPFKGKPHGQQGKHKSEGKRRWQP
jgi:ATP-dependent RNA helicase DeaD